MTKILQRDDNRLRIVSKEVSIKEITSSKIKRIIREMKSAMNAEIDGVGIAAPQLGYNIRIFVVSGRVLKAKKTDIDAIETKNEKKAAKQITEYDAVFINPTITKISKKDILVEEGCLSVRPLYGKVLRKEKATIKACNEDGKIFTRGASGIIAQIFQHEIDHLNGILFTDKTKDLYEIKQISINKNGNA